MVYVMASMFMDKHEIDFLYMKSVLFFFTNLSLFTDLPVSHLLCRSSSMLLSW